MEFAKYYDVSKLVDNMIEKQEIDSYPSGTEKFEGVYICADTNDFWICRITKGYNTEFEEDEGKYLVERNKISIYDVMDKLHELYGKELPLFLAGESQFHRKNNVHEYFKEFDETSIARVVILLDDEDNLSNWDYFDADSLQEAITEIDGGFGILQL